MDIFSRKHLAAWTIGVLVVMNVITLGALWFSILRRPAPGPGPGGEGPAIDVRRFLERELGLTEEQSARFEELRRRHAEAILAAQNEIRRLKKAEMDELLAETPDRTRIEALAVEVGAKETEKEKLVLAHLRDLMDICRPDQRERFRSIMGEVVRMIAPQGQRPPGEKPPPKKPADRPDSRPGDRPPQKRR